MSEIGNAFPTKTGSEFDNEGGVDVSRNREFEWDSSIQGQLLSAYGIGYIFGNISGGTLCALFGGKIYMTIALGISALLQFLSPIAAKQSHWFLYGLRLIFGSCVSNFRKFSKLKVLLMTMRVPTTNQPRKVP